MPVVLVTGASGLLGRAVRAAFAAAPGWVVVGAGHSRVGGDTGLVPSDLRTPGGCAALVEAHAPDVVVHAAAERRPDVCERDAAASEVLNVEAVWALARAAAARGAAFVQVSTDYLWDGEAAPYREGDAASPPNEYGRQKLRGEHAALAAHPNAIILRVPVLYGPTTDLAESAVTMFAAVVLAADKPATVDDWQIRVPTLTTDVGATLVNVAAAAVAAAAGGPAGGQTAVRGVYHYSSTERYTRWGLVQDFGRLLGRSTAHVTRLDGPPPGAPRPRDCQLCCDKLAAAGLAAPCTPFGEGAAAVLRGAGAVA